MKFLNLRTKSVAEYGRIAETPAKNKPAECVPKAVTTTVLTDKDGKLLGQTVETDAEMEKPTPEPPPLRIDFGKVGSEERVTSLMSDTVRPPGTSYVPHTLRKWGDLWYYVPIQFKPEFSDLCLSLVARGSRTASATGNGGPPKKKDAATKALEQLKSEFMQQNSLSLPK